MKKNVHRPKGTYAARYIQCRKSILKWRSENKDYIKEYNKQYQKTYRKDAIKYKFLSDRIYLRGYLIKKVGKSKRVEMQLGMNRAKFAAKHNMTEDKLKQLLKTHEINCIISAVHMHKPEYAHLSKYLYRHYNLEIQKKYSNRTRHKYIDFTNSKTKLALLKMLYDYAVDTENNNQLKDIKNQIIILEKQLS